MYLSRTVDRAGQTANVRLRAKRYGAATEPTTLHGYAASLRPMLEMKASGLPPAHTELSSSKKAEQADRSRSSQHCVRTKVMPGFNRAATTISGIELMHRIGKAQFSLATLDPKDTATLTALGCGPFGSESHPIEGNSPALSLVIFPGTNFDEC